MKNILFLLVCIVLVALSWAVFQVLGQHTFTLMLVITIVLLLFKVKKAKFGGKK